MTDAWGAFEARMNEQSDLGGVMGLLGWDEQTMCPPGGRGARAHHGATIAAIAHQRLVDPAYGEAIEAAAALPDLTVAQQAMVREARRSRDKATKLPEAFVRAMAQTRPPSPAGSATAPASRRSRSSRIRPVCAASILPEYRDRCAATFSGEKSKASMPQQSRSHAVSQSANRLASSGFGTSSGRVMRQA